MAHRADEHGSPDGAVFDRATSSTSNTSPVISKLVDEFVVDGFTGTCAQEIKARPRKGIIRISESGYLNLTCGIREVQQKTSNACGNFRFFRKFRE
jgi:hypothetical protein